tara:strand:- start:4 stop:231 length:228 start_codon:yes stop_codon:yes gene_type:complete
MKLSLLLIYLLGAAETKLLEPQQVELVPEENLQPKMKVRPGLRFNPAGPVDRAKGRPKDEKNPSRRVILGRKSKK